MHQVFDPDDMRTCIANWEEVAGELVRHLHNDVAAAPFDEKPKALLQAILGYPEVPERWHVRAPDATSLPLLATVFRQDGTELTFFSTFTTFGTAHDVTIEELRIECMFPADEVTAAQCRALATAS